MTKEAGQGVHAYSSFLFSWEDPDFSLTDTNARNWFMEELNLYSDRGAAILGANYLEWRLRDAIRGRVAVVDEHADELLGTPDTTGSLRFSNQCKLAYLLGIVGPIGLHDLEIIGTIRNRFAHRLLVREFSSEKIKGQCDELKIISLDPEPSTQAIVDPRGRFVMAVFLLALMISASVRHYNADPTATPPPPFFAW